MAVYRYHRSYRPELDVRDWSDLAQEVDQSEPNGVFWPIVGGRRSGKTWALHGLRQRLGKDRASVLDLRDEDVELEPLGSSEAPVLLLDEPGRLLEREDGAVQLVRKLAELRRRRVRCVAALTPREWQQLRDADDKGHRVDVKDLQHGLHPLSPDQARRMARTSEAQTLLDRLEAEHPDWCRSPYLLEMVFHTAEVRQTWDEPRETLRIALETCEGHQVRYAFYVYLDGLTDEQRGVLRDVAAGRNVSNSRTARLLTSCGMVSNTETGRRLGDPVLGRELMPLRLHHLSDLHFGAHTAQSLHLAEETAHAKELARAAGAGPVRDEYLKDVERLAQAGKAPQIVIVSGDLAQWGQPDELEEARDWLERLRPLLAAHSGLRPDDERLVIVGGNHDVDWKLSREAAERGRRHEPFARVFEGWPRPELEKPPEERSRARVAYDCFERVEIYLLGSSELGGEAEEQAEVRELAEKLRALAVDEDDRERARELQEKVTQIDPGLVAREDLDRLPGPPAAPYETVRIAVVHHPLSPLPFTSVERYGGLVNAGVVKDRLLQGRFCLALHGHMHMGWFAEERWPGQYDDWALRIASAPSLGSEEAQERPGFNEIEIRPDLVAGESRGDLRRRVEVTVRRRVYQGAGWQVEAVMGPFEPGRHSTG